MGFSPWKITMKMDKHGECNWIGEKKTWTLYIYMSIWSQWTDFREDFSSWKPWVFKSTYRLFNSLFAFRPMRRRWRIILKVTMISYNMGMSENGVYPQWNSHLVGIMISKTIGCRGTLFSDKPIWLYGLERFKIDAWHLKMEPQRIIPVFWWNFRGQKKTFGR